MENTTDSQTQPNKKDNAILFYILGGVVVTAVIVAGFLLMPKGNTTPTAQTGSEVMGEKTVEPTAAPVATRPINTLACTQQYYNTVNGVSETYFLSTDGEVPTAGGQVTCTITASVNNQVVTSQQVTPAMLVSADRGGSTFKCTTQGMKLKPGTPTKVTTDVKDATGNSVTCARTFLLP